MKKLHLTALLLGAALFTGMGATALSAEGKCGKAMEKPNGKCGDDRSERRYSKCGDDRDERRYSKCGDDRDERRNSKCGDERKAPNKAMKCGQGKCG
ncbi:MAG: hypothetical protein ABFQ64_02520 [Campylobacterota bacterium]